MSELRGMSVFDGDIHIAQIARKESKYCECGYYFYLTPIGGDCGWSQSLGSEIKESDYSGLFACSICHGCAKTEYLEPTGSRLAEKHICFTCDHWLELIRKDAGEYKGRCVIVDGKHYVMGENTTEPHRWSGFGGDTFIIEFIDGRKATSNNLWHQGTIPGRWREQLPDNAKFVRPTQQVPA